MWKNVIVFFVTVVVMIFNVQARSTTTAKPKNVDDIILRSSSASVDSTAKQSRIPNGHEAGSGVYFYVLQRTTITLSERCSY